MIDCKSIINRDQNLNKIAYKIPYRSNLQYFINTVTLNTQDIHL